MRGYISFLLVFAAFAIFVILADAYGNSKSLNFSKAIAFERMEQLSLDAKRSMLTSAKYGAIAGFLEYIREVINSGGIELFDPAAAKERIKDGVYFSLLLLNFFGEEDYQIALWCGEVSGESELNSIAERSLRDGAPKMCANCQPIVSPSCKDYVNVDILNIDENKPAMANLALGSENLGQNPRIFGLTIYSRKFNISKVSYIPTSEKIFEVPYLAPDEMIK